MKYSLDARHYVALLAALVGGCAISTADPTSGAPIGTGNEKDVGQAREALVVGCFGTTSISSGSVWAWCPNLPGYLCNASNGCSLCNSGDGRCTPGCYGSGGANVPTSSVTVSCSSFSASECQSHVGCTLLTDDPLKQGYWFSPSRSLPGSRGYYVNELAQYCVLDSWEQCVAAGTLCTDPDKSHNTSWFPPTMTNAGECKLPAGYFFNNGTGYYANPAGHYCAFTSWNQWLAAGGPRSGARTFPKIPTSMSYDGICGATSSGSSSGTPYNPNQGACPDGYVDCNLSAWPGSGCQPGTALDYNTCF